MSRPDTAENLAQENIQGVVIHLVKINNPIGRIQPHQRMGANLRKENPPYQPTPSRAALASAR